MDVHRVCNADVHVALKKNVKKDWLLRQWFPLGICAILICIITDFQFNLLAPEFGI